MMASGRIQRWALTLGAYDYCIRYRQGKANANADALSRLPLPSTAQDVPTPAEVVHLMEYLTTTPLSSAQIKTWTDMDPVLSKVRHWVLEGWREDRIDSETNGELIHVDGTCLRPSLVPRPCSSEYYARPLTANFTSSKVTCQHRVRGRAWGRGYLRPASFNYG